MNIKVKVKDQNHQMEIFKYSISLEDTLNKVIEKLVHDLPYLTHEVARLTYEDNYYREFNQLKIGKIFEGTNHIEVSSETLTLDLKLEEGNTKNKHHLNLDYSQFIKASDAYIDIETEYNVENGTIFYIQQDKEQYLVRKEENHLEFFHFKRQFEDAFKDERLPFFVIEFKTRSEMTQKEIHWIKKYRYPKKSAKNPVIHILVARLSQSILDDITVLVHRVFTVIGRFKTVQAPLNEIDKLPTYTEMDKRVSIGWVEKLQLERILAESNRNHPSS